MPILDLQVQIAEDKSVDFKFYQKPMAPPTTILNRSAIPVRVKWNNNVQQGIRRLRNTRPRLHKKSTYGGVGRGDDGVRVHRIYILRTILNS